MDSSGLLFARARWYDPLVGRFINRDPLAGDPASPSSLNGFNYGNANPLTWTDPSGLDPSRHGSNLDSYLNQRIAYSIASVFADLDSPDPATRNRAYAKVGIAGVGIATVAVLTAHLAVTSLAAPSSVEASSAMRLAVVGETQGRVDAVAATLARAGYQALRMPDLTGAPQAMKLAGNSAWVSWLIEHGITILDIGRDPDKVQRGASVGIYYLNELLDVAVQHYPRVIHLAAP